MIPAPAEVAKNTKPATCECKPEQAFANTAHDGKESDVGKSDLCHGPDAALTGHSGSNVAAWAVPARYPSETAGLVPDRSIVHDTGKTLCLDSCRERWRSQPAAKVGQKTSA